MALLSAATLKGVSTSLLVCLIGLISCLTSSADMYCWCWEYYVTVIEFEALSWLFGGIIEFFWIITLGRLFLIGLIDFATHWLCLGDSGIFGLKFERATGFILFSWQNCHGLEGESQTPLIEDDSVLTPTLLILSGRCSFVWWISEGIRDGNRSFCSVCCRGTRFL